MTKEEAQQFYPFWRFLMHAKGYGSYDEIEEKIENGELKVFGEYPYLSKKT
jgi:hypothetical protein